jgi:hypothetical protein
MPAATLYKTIEDLADLLPGYERVLRAGSASSLSGICGFDGFIDTFIRMRQPSSMAEFGPKVTAAAGIATSYTVSHQGDKFGGNGPLFARALHDIFAGKLDVTYIGALGDKEVLPIFQEALGGTMKKLVSLADAAHTDCLEFSDGKVMLCDLDACADITWERLLERMGQEALDAELSSASYISAVNWGKLVNVGPIWSNLAQRLKELGRTPKEVVIFMDLAEFEHRGADDLQDLLGRLDAITEQCNSILSFNLKEAWQMGSVFGGDFHGKKDPESVARLAALLFENIKVDRIIIHPNDGAACASERGTVYVPGPFCADPLISTGAGDNFGAGCLAATLLGMDDTAIVLAGNCTSGTFVRSGRSPSLADIASFLDLWKDGSLPERL